MVMQLGYAAYFHGAPGIGKSYVLESLARQNGWAFHAEFLAQKTSGEVRGLPFINKSTGVTEWTMPDFIAAAKNNEQKMFLLLLDELSAATPDVQVSGYQLLQSRQLGAHKLPDNVLLCGAGNRPEDGAIAYEMGSALSDRVCHFHVTCDLDSWMTWAEAEELHPDILGFMRAKPRYLNSQYIDSDYGTGNQQQEDDDYLIMPTPRSWHRVSNALYAYPDQKDTIINFVLPGWVGLMAAHAFSTFVRRMSDNYPIEEYYKHAQNDAKLKSMCPIQQDVLYGTLYNVVHVATTFEHLEIAAKIINVLCNVSSNHYGEEIKSVAFDLWVKKLFRQQMQNKMIKSPYYTLVSEHIKKGIALQNKLNGG
jgi:hypothetical protein